MTKAEELQLTIDEAFKKKEEASEAHIQSIKNYYNAIKAHNDYFTKIDDDQEYENSKDNEEGIADKCEDERQSMELNG